MRWWLWGASEMTKPDAHKKHTLGFCPMKTLYKHPDGEGEIFFEAATGRLFLFNDAEGLSAYALIGPAGMRDVAAKLLALADEVEAKE